MFYKSDEHKKDTEKILQTFGISDIAKDIEYGSIAYVVAATYKTDDFITCIDDDNNIDLDKLFKSMEVWSYSEKSMIRFALQCFNGSIDDIKLSDVMRSLDDDNTKVIKQAIDIRY